MRTGRSNMDWELPAQAMNNYAMDRHSNVGSSQGSLPLKLRDPGTTVDTRRRSTKSKGFRGRNHFLLGALQYVRPV